MSKISLVSAFFVAWDDVRGPHVTMTHPSSLQVDARRVMTLLTTMQALGSGPRCSLEVREGPVTYLVHGVPVSPRAGEFVYDFLVVVLEGADDVEVANAKLILSRDGPRVVGAPEDQRLSVFSEMVKSISEPPLAKVLFVGTPGAGKSSTRRFVFERVAPEDLLDGSSEPTTGFETWPYALWDLQCRVFDTSGQEMDAWVGDRSQVFEGADFVFFFFSVEDWNDHSARARVLDAVGRFEEAARKEGARYVVFCNKFDLIEARRAGAFRENVRDKLASKTNAPVYFTSLVDGGNADLHEGLGPLLEQYSKIVRILREILEEVCSEVGAEPLFVTSGSLVVPLAPQNERGPVSVPRARKGGVSSRLAGGALAMVRRVVASANNLVDATPDSFVLDFGASGVLSCTNLATLEPRLGFLVCSLGDVGDHARLIAALDLLQKRVEWKQFS
ncbi:MAG: hypothetical protein Kow0069_33700 [Promethearchaeota archaeon]